MILEFFMDMVSGLIILIFNILPNLPNVPQNGVDAIYSFLDIVFNNVGLLGVFLPIQHVKILIPLILVVLNFEYIYYFVIWVLRKIPTININ